MTDDEWGAQEMYLQVTNDYNMYVDYLVETHRINNMVCKEMLPGHNEWEPERPLSREERIWHIFYKLVEDLGDYQTSGRKPKPRIVLMEGMGHGQAAKQMAAERLYDFFCEELEGRDMDNFQWNPYLTYKREYED